MRDVLFVWFYAVPMVALALFCPSPHDDEAGPRARAHPLIADAVLALMIALWPLTALAMLLLRRRLWQK